MAFPFYRPHKVLSTPGSHDFLRIGSRPEQEDLPKGNVSGDQPPTLSFYEFSEAPPASLDPRHCWNDVIEIINLRIKGPYIIVFKDSDGGGFDASGERDNTGRTPLMNKVTKKSHKFTLADIILARNTLRALNGDIRFAQIKPIWSFETIRDLLEPRWNKTFFSEDHPAQQPPDQSFSSSQWGMSELSGGQFSCDQEYGIDFKDGYGVRNITTSTSTKQTPPELLERWALEDTIIGGKPKKSKASITYYQDNSVPNVGSGGSSIVIRAEVFRANKDGVQLVAQSEATKTNPSDQGADDVPEDAPS